MAYIDINEEIRRDAMNTSYKTFRESLEIDSDMKTKNIFLIYYLDDMEDTIKKQEEKINKYKSFFSMLNSFLPKSFSNNKII